MLCSPRFSVAGSGRGAVVLGCGSLRLWTCLPCSFPKRLASGSLPLGDVCLDPEGAPWLSSGSELARAPLQGSYSPSGSPGGRGEELGKAPGWGWSELSRPSPPRSPAPLRITSSLLLMPCLFIGENQSWVKTPPDC